jgi:hypothetical protein
MYVICNKNRFFYTRARYLSHVTVSILGKYQPQLARPLITCTALGAVTLHPWTIRPWIISPWKNWIMRPWDYASMGLCVPRIMRPWDYASIGRFVPGRFVAICPHFSDRTILVHPQFESSRDASSKDAWFRVALLVEHSILYIPMFKNELYSIRGQNWSWRFVSRVNRGHAYSWVIHFIWVYKQIFTIHILLLIYR